MGSLYNAIFGTGKFLDYPRLELVKMAKKVTIFPFLHYSRLDLGLVYFAIIN